MLNVIKHLRAFQSALYKADLEHTIIHTTGISKWSELIKELLKTYIRKFMTT